MTQIDLKTQWLTRFKLAPADLHLPITDGMPTPTAYIAAGVDPDSYLGWYDVCGFDISGMQELEDAGIDLRLTGELTSEGCGGYNNTITYKYCNGDLSLDRIRAILGC